MLVRGLFARCEGREHASDLDWCPVEGGGFCRDVPEGTLLLAKDGENWVLCWCRATQIVRVVAYGSRNEVENDARELVLFGIPGGSGEPSGPSGWGFDEGSLIRETATGAFRLMLLPGGRGSLVFVRHDAEVVFLGEDRADTLMHTAELRLREHPGAPLHVWFARRRLPMRGLGTLGVIGQAELARDVRVVLVHVDHDLFELYVTTRREAYDLIGVYTGADLLRGDLGAILVSNPAQRAAARCGPPAGQSMATPTVERVLLPAAPEPPRPPTAVGHAPPPPVTDEDLRRLATCLTPPALTGAGSSALPYIYDGFRILVTEGRENELLRTKVLRALLEKKLGVLIPGHTRTFTRALMRFLEVTGLGRRQGRRVFIFFGDLRRGDSEVVAMLRARHAPELLPAAEPPAQPAVPPAAARTSIVPPPGNGPMVERPDPHTRPAATMRSVAHDSAGPEGGEPVLEEPPAQRWQRALRGDGPTFWERVYSATPSPDNPSQFLGVNPRGPPKS